MTIRVRSSMCTFQVKLLSSLGLESTLITNGDSPINLFMTAQGLVQTPGGQAM